MASFVKVGCFNVSPNWTVGVLETSEFASAFFNPGNGGYEDLMTNDIGEALKVQDQVSEVSQIEWKRNETRRDEARNRKMTQDLIEMEWDLRWFSAAAAALDRSWLLFCTCFYFGFHLVRRRCETTLICRFKFKRFYSATWLLLSAISALFLQL